MCKLHLVADNYLNTEEGKKHYNTMIKFVTWKMEFSTEDSQNIEFCIN
jgi:hypothetical protein